MIYSTWKELLPLNVKSEVALDVQLVTAITSSIKNELLNQGDRLPNPQDLARALEIDALMIEKAYAQLMSMHHLVKTNQQWIVQSQTFTHYRLPLPFSRRNYLKADDQILNEKIRTRTLTILPKIYQDRFPFLTHHQALFIEKEFYSETGLVATSSVYYLLQPHETKDDVMLEKRIHKTDHYVRTIDVIKTHENLKKTFKDASPMLLKGFYYFQRDKHTILEIGEVYTTLIYTYEMFFPKTITKKYF